MGQTTLLRRDEFGQVVEEVDAAGNSRHHEYNEAGQVVRATDCSGHTTRYQYHPLGWLMTETGADGEDALSLRRCRTPGTARSSGRLDRVAKMEQTWPAGEACWRRRESEFRYDEAGRLTATRNTGEEVRRRWDSRGV